MRRPLTRVTPTLILVKKTLSKVKQEVFSEYGHLSDILAEDELKERSVNPDRGKSDLELIEESHAMREVSELPGPSITINTSGESPEQTVQNIIAMLPDDMKTGIMI